MDNLQIARHPRHFSPEAAALKAAEAAAGMNAVPAPHKPLRAEPGPYRHSRAAVLAILLGALVVTALLVGSQLDIAMGYTADADARQLAAARSRELAQQSCARSHRHSLQSSGQAASSAPACAPAS